MTFKVSYPHEREAALADLFWNNIPINLEVMQLLGKDNYYGVLVSYNIKLSNGQHRDELAKRIRHHRPLKGRPDYQLHYDSYLQTGGDCRRGIKSYNGSYGIGKASYCRNINPNMVVMKKEISL